MGGVGFTALNRVRVQVGDTLKVKFTLDKVPPEIVEKQIIVRTIKDNYIGCEFRIYFTELATPLRFCCPLK